MTRRSPSILWRVYGFDIEEAMAAGQKREIERAVFLLGLEWVEIKSQGDLLLARVLWTTVTLM